MSVLWGFIFLKQYTPDFIHILFFFIHSLSCHKKILRNNSFIKNKTHIKSSLIYPNAETIQVYLHASLSLADCIDDMGWRKSSWVFDTNAKNLDFTTVQRMDKLITVVLYFDLRV
jgi:hypothetical protein